LAQHTSKLDNGGYDGLMGWVMLMGIKRVSGGDGLEDFERRYLCLKRLREVWRVFEGMRC